METQGTCLTIATRLKVDAYPLVELMLQNWSWMRHRAILEDGNRNPVRHVVARQRRPLISPGTMHGNMYTRCFDTSNKTERILSSLVPISLANFAYLPSFISLLCVICSLSLPC